MDNLHFILIFKGLALALVIRLLAAPLDPRDCKHCPQTAPGTSLVTFRDRH